MISIALGRNLDGADGTINMDVRATIASGELITLYGPTGSGKSSILRMLAGLMEPHEGTITIADEVWFDSENDINLKPQYRNVGMVFQEYSLFPNMTVRENLEYALSANQDRNIVEELLDIAELKNLEHKRPNTLSGGQKQRVALTRALVRKPKLLLLDEPLSALDSEMRSKLQDFILQFHQQFNLTTILVSHDLHEVLKMSKRILVLEKGQIKADTSPQALFKIQFSNSI
jgi:molybdate transport system ATP-binding protein